MPQDDYILKNGNPMTGQAYGNALGYPLQAPQLQVQPQQMGAPVNGADMLASFALVPTTPITPPQSPYSPRVAQSGELNDMLNQSPETQFLGKPTPPPSPTPAPAQKPSNQYAV
jgi:hypothetical protein